MASENNIKENSSTPCEAHIAFVIDESSSINSTEAAEIRTGLQSFVDTQIGSPFFISFIGMSANDSNNRNDHILYQKITQSNKASFDNWITQYRNGSVSPQSDYWASGLQVVENLANVPDIIVIITDGLQVSNTLVLASRITTLNNQSHIFFYGIAIGAYKNTQGANVNLVPCLTDYLNRTQMPRTLLSQRTL